MKLLRIVFAVFFVGVVSPAYAACTGQFLGGTLCANNGPSQGIPGPTANPILGVPGVNTGSIGLAGSGSGTAVISAQTAAGTPTLLMPTQSGTIPSNVSSPIVLNLVSGNLSCPTCVVGAGGALINGTTPTSGYSNTQILSSNGSVLSAYSVSGTGNVVLQNNSSLTSPTINTSILMPGSGSGTATIVAQAAAGTPTLSLPTLTGTFPSTATSPIVLNAVTGNLSLTTPLALNFGGTNNSLTASNGGIVWSDASKLNILAGTATASQMLQSGATATPAWSTNTWPNTNAQGDILYGSAANVLSTLAKNTNTTRYLANTGTSNNPNWDFVNLANGVTGNLPTTNLNSGTSASATTFWNGGNGTTGQWLSALTSLTPGGGLVSSITANCSQTAVTTTGTLSRGDCVNPQSGASYTISDSDRGKTITGSNSGAQAYSIAQTSTASSFFSGWTTLIENNSINASAIITITATTSQLCAQGACASTYKIQPGQFARLTSDGTNYQVTENPIASQLPAAQTNITVNAGNLNEIKTQTILSGSAVSLSNGTAANIATITLTAGNWNIWAQPAFTGTGSTVVTGIRASISTTSATENAAAPNFISSSFPSTGLFVTFDWSAGIDPIPVSLSGSQQYWLVGRCNFSASTCSGYGTLTAQRTD